ncbi:MAG: FtsX-like permease family protein [Verrucomicrobiae bacterium]|nr:FtsX-like permease family protein [Verrucomicrobiae bacterium]
MRRVVIILRELRYHRVQTLLAVLGLAVATALLTAVRMTSAAAERETRRVMRDLGFNLRIVAKETDPAQFWRDGFPERTLPEDSVRRLAAQHGVFLTFNHLTPVLERRHVVDGREVLLTGLGPSVVGPGEGKQPMGFRIPDGRLHLGAAVAASLGVARGGALTLGGRPFAVDRVLTESGTEDDIRIFASLADAQSLLGLPGQISEIKAVDCLCLTSEQDALGALRRVLAEILPEADVLQVRHLADARARQRQMATRHAAFAVPLAVGAAALWTGVFLGLNVRERRAEIGLWRALGRNSAAIASLFLGRAALLGLIGAVAGVGIGTALALHWGPRLFPVTAGAMAPDPVLMVCIVVLTPCVAAIAAVFPALLAVAQDPAECLRAD